VCYHPSKTECTGTTIEILNLLKNFKTPHLIKEITVTKVVKSRNPSDQIADITQQFLQHEIFILCPGKNDDMLVTKDRIENANQYRK